MTEQGSPTVRPGQIWEDNDYRAKGRTLRVDAVDDTHAECTVLTDRTTATYRHPGGYVHQLGSTATVGRKTRIARRRFRPTSTGYRLVQDVQP
ncbi:DUF6354 family protein [Micromonospora carbonacea]|uniref:Uncharacterized protein n=1 Tax=Micromonospora carbonacea TaxID=47853 RepID=A0A1C5A245_9ACTN|nr:DUF6354 family protein [Micromonospora carbonacea]SCF39292.1 hypothetical protein GA0070563_1113 [Micromonospora carbonacea]